MRPRAATSADAMARLADYFVEVVAEPAVLQSEDFERKIVTRIPSSDHPDFALPDGVPFVSGYNAAWLVFCIPESVAFFNPTVYERKPTFFSFILTGGDGAHAYGFALHFFEEYTTSASDWRPRVLCLISHHPFFSLFKEIVSFFSNGSLTRCSWMYRSRNLKAEDSLVQTKIAYACEDRSWFLSPRHASPALPAQEQLSFNSRGLLTDSALHLLAGMDPRAKLSYPPAAHTERKPASSRQGLRYPDAWASFFLLPRATGKAVHLDDYCFQMLFQCLSLKNVIYIVNCLLLEQRVLVHSSVRSNVFYIIMAVHVTKPIYLSRMIQHQGLLTPICEALCALLFPFSWKHVFIPFLPVKLIEYLQAPVPYFIGLHTSSLATRVGAEMFASCVVVHLDKDKVVSPIFSRVDDYPVDFVLPRLPSKEVTALLTALENIVPSPVGHTPPVQKNPTPESPQNDSNTVNEVELTFDEGPLGITFESTHLRLLAATAIGWSAVVKALPRCPNGLIGPAERSGLISAGSYLIGINGQSTLDLTFEETIDYLRRASRPIRLRFLNATLPTRTPFFSWVDTLRGAFAVMFASIFCDYRRYIDVRHQESDMNDPSGTQHALPTPEQFGRLRRRSSALAFLCSSTTLLFVARCHPTSDSYASSHRRNALLTLSTRVSSERLPHDLVVAPRRWSFSRTRWFTSGVNGAQPANGFTGRSCGSRGFNYSKDDEDCSSKSNPVAIFERTRASSAGEVASAESPLSSPASSPFEGKVNLLVQAGSPGLDNHVVPGEILP
ncbi:uDENN domain [Phytophthora cactorum]|nr:uDENN domain [Phytophthora cactorum]